VRNLVPFIYILKVPDRVSFKAFFFGCSQGGDHPENNLAKFGYIYFFLAIYWNLS
jgi:hypothetical protein